MKGHKSLSSWKIIIVLAVPTVAIAIIILITKRKKKNNVNDECELSFQTYIIHENNNELNAQLI